MERTMTTNAIEGTAKIYQFPKGGRAGLSSGRHETNLSESPVMPRIARVACGGASYHEAAIREEERSRNH
jgi:Protein of unknown function (DUF2735)